MKSLIKSRCIFVSLICLFLAYNAKPIFAEVIWQTFSANSKAEGEAAEAAFRNAVEGSLIEINFDEAEFNTGPYPEPRVALDANHYAHLGVKFETKVPGSVLYVSGWPTPHSPPNKLSPEGSSPNSDHDDLWMNFSGAVSAVGFWIIQNMQASPESEWFTVYGEGGQALHSIEIPVTGDFGEGFIGIVASEPVIRSAFCDEDSGHDGVDYDNFLFTQPIPEPAIVLLFGLGAMVLRRRKYRRRANSINHISAEVRL